MERYETTYKKNFSGDKHTIHKKEALKDLRNKLNQQSTPKLCVKDLLTHNEITNTNQQRASKKLSTTGQLPQPQQNFQNQEQYMNSWMYGPPMMQQSSSFNMGFSNGNQMMRTDDGDKNKMKVPPQKFVMQNNAPPHRGKSGKRIGMKDILCHIEDLGGTNVPRKQSFLAGANQPRNVSGEKKLPSKCVTMKDILYHSEPKAAPERSNNRLFPAKFPTKIGKVVADSGSFQNGAQKQVCTFCGKHRDANANFKVGQFSSSPDSTIAFMSSNMGNLASQYFPKK